MKFIQFLESDKVETVFPQAIMPQNFTNLINTQKFVLEINQIRI